MLRSVSVNFIKLLDRFFNIQEKKRKRKMNKIKN